MRGGRETFAVMVLAMALAAAGWWFGSPWWTLREMRAAADAHDAARLSYYIDYPALRADLKGELNQAKCHTPGVTFVSTLLKATRRPPIVW